MKTVYLSTIQNIETSKPRLPWAPILSSVMLTAGMLIIVQVMVDRPMLMVDRFFLGMGWIEIVALSIYAGFMTPKILNPGTSTRWRLILWLTFSVIFFSQLTLGILGFDSFLMTGKLHLPIPALIIGGPIYRGEGFFMPILFGSTLLFIGPAWCSYFCYIGSWDLLASQKLKRPRRIPKWWQPLRIALLVLMIAAAYFLRRSGLPVSVAIWLAAVFGLGGIAIMAVISRKQGNMVHCTSYCPVGLVANVFGKISPFRMRINEACSACRKCSMVCRYDALKPENIEQKKPGLTCTLCGDCVDSCEDGFIHYSFPGLSSKTARTLFIVLVVSFHAVSIGIARI